MYFSKLPFRNYNIEILQKITASIFPTKFATKKSTKGHFYLADVAKMNHVRGSGGGAQIRASHSQSDPVSLGKTTFRCHVSCASIGPKLFWAGPRFFENGSHS